MHDLDTLLRKAAIVHGHLCPGQVLGVRMALAGCRALGIDEPRTSKRLLVYLEIDRCVADAIGSVTGCRLGKRTMKHIDYGKLAATFGYAHRSGGARDGAGRGAGTSASLRPTRNRWPPRGSDGGIHHHARRRTGSHTRGALGRARGRHAGATGQPGALRPVWRGNQRPAQSAQQRPHTVPSEWLFSKANGVPSEWLFSKANGVPSEWLFSKANGVPSEWLFTKANGVPSEWLFSKANGVPCLCWRCIL